MAFDITETDVPATLGAPNPFTALVKDLPTVQGEDRTGKARSFLIPALDGGKVDAKTVKTVKRQLSEAGRDNSASVRKIVRENEDGSVAVTFWRVGKISKARKSAEAAPATPAASASGAKGRTK